MIRDWIERKIFLEQARRAIRHLEVPPYGEAQGLAARVYDQMRRDFQLVPPITLHSPVPKLLAGIWSVGRETLIAGTVSRAKREAVATAVSRINECPFCVDVHTLMLHGASEHGASKAIRRGRWESIADPSLRDVVRWASATRSPGSEVIREPPFSAEEAPQIIGTAVGFHYINRVVHVFLGASPFPVPPFLLRWRGPIARVAGAVLGRRLARLSPPKGESLDLLPEARLPEKDFDWARGDPSVAGAFARLAAVMEDLSREWIPEEVRRVVEEEIRTWNGEVRGPDRRWAERPLERLPEPLRPAGELALLSALASYQLGDGAIGDFRAGEPRGEALLVLVSWAAFTAARRIGSWLRAPKKQ